MIPLKTLPDSPAAPLCTRGLAIIVAIVWLVQLGYGALRSVDLAARWGVRPACYFHPGSCGVTGISLPPGEVVHWGSWANSGFGHLILSPFTSLWLHADWWHVGFNLLFLLVFGGALENEIGRFRFLRLYLGGGLVATACHVAFNLGSAVPTIGASGAIAAVLGAYFWRLPKAWVLTYFPPVFLFPVPAPVFGILWIAAQFAGVWHNFRIPFSPSAGGGSIAWMAHIGGFVWGAWAIWRGRKRRTVQKRAAPRSKAVSNMGK